DRDDGDDVRWREAGQPGLMVHADAHHVSPARDRLQRNVPATAGRTYRLGEVVATPALAASGYPEHSVGHASPELGGVEVETRQRTHDRPPHVCAHTRRPLRTKTAPWFASGESHRADSVSRTPARSASGSAAPAAARSATGSSVAQMPGGWTSRRCLTAPSTP